MNTLAELELECTRLRQLYEKAGAIARSLMKENEHLLEEISHLKEKLRHTASMLCEENLEHGEERNDE